MPWADEQFKIHQQQNHKMVFRLDRLTKPVYVMNMWVDANGLKVAYKHDGKLVTAPVSETQSSDLYDPALFGDDSPVQTVYARP